MSADNVVVATGAYHHPRVPPFASELSSGIVQLHSSEYRNPAQLQAGGVLRGRGRQLRAEIAIDLADHHRVWLSGPDTGQEPTRAGTIPDRLLMPIMWLGATRLTVKTPIGRKLRDHFLDPPRGIPLGRVRRKDIAAAGIERVGRMTGVNADTRCSRTDGHRRLRTSSGAPASHPTSTGSISRYRSTTASRSTIAGIVESCPGLYFIGLLFLYSLSSALLGGVGRDAKHIVDHIVSTRSRRSHQRTGQNV